MRPMPWAIVGQATTPHELQTAIDTVVANNLAQLASGDIPPLYESGVVYERETRAAPPRGVERFQTARDCYMLGHADCDGLAPWRAAELIDQGEHARALVVPSSVGYHVLVEREDGSVEDPSALLGMLDGHRLDGDDARPSARARRRRMMAALIRKGRTLVERAAQTQGAPQRAMLAQAARIGRMVNGLERQAAADGDPPLTDAELEESTDGSVGDEPNQLERGLMTSWERMDRRGPNWTPAVVSPPSQPRENALTRFFHGAADDARAAVLGGALFGPLVLASLFMFGRRRR